MNSLVARQQGPAMVMDEIPRTYYPGRGFLSDQEAYPTDLYGNPRMPEIPKDVFNRSPRYSGGMNVPGAPGNLQTLPYYGGPMNPTPMPYYAGQDYGGVQLLGASPSFEIPQGQGRNPNYSIYNDPRLPGARNLRRKLEGILGLPKYNFPQALAPANFDRKFVS